VQAGVLGLKPGRSKGETIGVIMRTLLCAHMLASIWLVRRSSEIVSVLMFFVLVLCFPMLNHQRACWAAGEKPEPLGDWLGNDVPESDVLFIVLMLAVVIAFLVLIPVRVKYGWVIPALTPVVYLCWTLWLPESGPEG